MTSSQFASIRQAWNREFKTGRAIRCPVRGPRLDSPHQPARLAMAAEVGDALIRANERDGPAAARAWLAGLHVHRHEFARLQVDILAHQDANTLDGVEQRLSHAIVEAASLFLG